MFFSIRGIFFSQSQFTKNIGGKKKNDLQITNLVVFNALSDDLDAGGINTR